MEGWIKLHRKIIEHWIFVNPIYFRAWIIMLFTVNYEYKKTLINGQIIECDRGQSILSLESWVDIFGVSKKKGSWTIQKVRTFFELLEQDNMIIKENLIKTTRITICNYNTYQDVQQPSNNQVTTKQQPSNNQITTTKERKEIKNDKNIYSENQNIFLKDEEYEKLKKDFPELYDKAIQFLSNYKIEKNYKTKSDYLTIRRWVIEAVKSKQPQVKKDIFTLYRENKQINAQ